MFLMTFDDWLNVVVNLKEKKCEIECKDSLLLFIINDDERHEGRVFMFLTVDWTKDATWRCHFQLW